MCLHTIALQPLLPATNRNQPIGSHLKFVIQRLHRAIVEGIFRLLAFRCPNQRLVRVGKSRTLKIGHWVGFSPNDVVQNPISSVLHRRANAENIMVTANHPQRAVRLQNTPRLGQPFTGKFVINRKACKFVPFIVDGIDLAIVRAQQIAAKLQIIGRIGKDHVDGAIR